MIQLSLSFLATSSEQFEAIRTMNLTACEAVIFNKSDMNYKSWDKIWKNIESAAIFFLPQNVVFHFPVNDCDYVENNFVYQKLKESYQRASDLGLKGIVVHSNRVRLIKEWKSINLDDERHKVVNSLNDIMNSYKNSSTWIGLENMPVMDNYGIEIDPLFCFPKDFNLLNQTDIGITWDICHYTNTMANIDKLIQGLHKSEYYPNFQDTNLSDFEVLKNKIVHWHFSAFNGICNPETDEICKEGVLPEQSSLGEKPYKDSLDIIRIISNSSQIMTLEIQEENYLIRENCAKMINWIRNNIKDDYN